ncbi:hypothetical protein Tco_0479586, partial [Tanacetum coccineum]
SADKDGASTGTYPTRHQVTTYAVRITWLIADIEDKYHGPSDTAAQPSLATQDPSKDSCFISHVRQ